MIMVINGIHETYMKKNIAHILQIQVGDIYE